MSRARHGFADGGKPLINKGREDVKEDRMAEGHKDGGAVKRKRGGSVEMGDGVKPKNHRLDRPGRKRGGAVGSNRSPLTTAANVSDADGHTTSDEAE